MDLGLHGKTALVFGAAGGLGSAIARALAAEGANLVLADINGDALSTIAQEIQDASTGMGTSPMTLTWDLADLSVIDRHISAIESHFGTVDILVNNTGGPPPTPVSGQAPSLWASSFQSMVLSVIAITDRVLPGMQQKKWGRIITSTSSGIIAPIANLGLSNALRMSLVGWSKTLAREVGRDGITANIVVPGRISTARIGFLDEQKSRREGRELSDIQAESVAAIALGRYGRPDEYGAVVTFLASVQASYVTGSVMRVDGGLIASV